MKRIDILPDDVLLGIFDFYVEIRSPYDLRRETEAWQTLVHVCRRWRSLVLGSPRRLNLRLLCTPETLVRVTLGVWPVLPLVVGGDMTPSSGTDNIVAALGESYRVCQVSLSGFAGWQLEQVLAAMQVPFPELTDLRFSSDHETMPVIPDSFLNGSAPRLRHFQLDGIPFPGLPKLHLSPTHLVKLELWNIPHSGYISPEAIVAFVSVLSSLESLHLLFQSPQSRPDQPPLPSRHSVMPSLRYFGYKGVIEYLEDLVTGIDAPQLDKMEITFFHHIDFDTPQLTQFINRTPKLGKRLACVGFQDNLARVRLSPRILQVAISCREPDRQLSSIERVCNSSLHPLSTVEDLYIKYRYRQSVWNIYNNDATESTLWLQLLLPFTAVKNLYLSKEFAPGIAAALQELVGGRITDVLPGLQNIFVGGLEPSGPVQKNIEQFVAARQLSDHTISISDWYERRRR